MLNLYNVFYYVCGVLGMDSVVGVSEADAMDIVEDFLLSWGYPNGSIAIDCAVFMGIV